MRRANVPKFSERMKHVFRLGNPFQVVGAVVLGVPVLVVDLIAFIAFSINERIRNKPMNMEHTSPIVSDEAY